MEQVAWQIANSIIADIEDTKGAEFGSAEMGENCIIVNYCVDEDRAGWATVRYEYVKELDAGLRDMVLTEIMRRRGGDMRKNVRQLRNRKEQSGGAKR